VPLKQGTLVDGSFIFFVGRRPCPSAFRTFLVRGKIAFQSGQSRYYRAFGIVFHKPAIRTEDGIAKQREMHSVSLKIEQRLVELWFKKQRIERNGDLSRVHRNGLSYGYDRESQKTDTKVCG